MISRYTKFYWRELDTEKIGEIFNEFGSPLFFFSEHALREKYQELQSALQKHYPRFSVAYALKANYLPHISRILKKEGALVEVGSGFEYRLAQKLGYQGPDVVFNGPLKSNEDLARAIHDRCILNIDNQEELSRTAAVAERLAINVRLGIRLNSCAPSLHEFGAERFGFNIENGEAIRVFSEIKKHKNLTLAGLHFHLGTNVKEPQRYERAAELLVSFISNLQKETGLPLEYVDFGGGFGVHEPKPKSQVGWRVPPIKDFIEAMTRPLKKINPSPKLIIEPGRFLTADCLSLATRVVSSRYDSPGQSHVIVDSSISMLPTAVFNAHPVYTNVSSGEKRPVAIFGASCMSHDFLGQALLPRLKEGDALFFEHCGAYALSRSSPFIFPVPAVVGVDASGTIVCLQPRQGFFGDINTQLQ